MGSATIQALGAARRVLNATPAKSHLRLGRELFASAAAVSASAQLRSALADGAAPAATKSALVERVFAAATQETRAVLAQVAASRWSSPADLVAGIEELAVRAIALSAPKSVSLSSELAAFAAAVRSDHSLEFAVGSTLVPGQQKAAVVRRLLEGRASEQTVEILSNLVSAARSRRIGVIVREATAIVADVSSSTVATVESATVLSRAQLDRIRDSLSARVDREITIEQNVNPDVLGGIRIRLGDEVIDGTVSRRLAELRLSLVG